MNVCTVVRGIRPTPCRMHAPGITTAHAPPPALIPKWG